MKDKITLIVLIMISITCSLTLVTFLFILLPWWGFSFLVFLAFLRFLIWKADKEYKNRTPEQQKLLDDLEMERYTKVSMPKAQIPTKPKPDLLQVAEMYRDDMQGSPAEGSLAYDVTIKAIDNYYKTAN